MTRSCPVCTTPLDNKHQMYCSRLCGNRAKTKQSIVRAKQLAAVKLAQALIHDDYAELPIANGYHAKVSIVDLDYVGAWKWNTNDHGYATRTVQANNKGGKSQSRMHREIMQRALGRLLRPDELIDHINGNRLDNRRENLRVCSIVQNAHNYGKYSGWTSKYKGVCWDKTRKKWKAEIKFDGKKWMIGRFDDEDVAAWMRDQWTLALHDEYAVLNFEYL